MTETLASKTCTPCRGGIPPLTREQAEIFHAQAPDWQLAEEAHRIERSFRFRNFREALTFVREIGELVPAFPSVSTTALPINSACAAPYSSKIFDARRSTDGIARPCQPSRLCCPKRLNGDAWANAQPLE
jgi:hypothetical protein